MLVCTYVPIMIIAHRQWVMNKSQRQAVPYVPSSFLIEANVQYLAIVSHPEVTAVVSNCNLDAAQEALYFGKPVLCLPFYMDQVRIQQRVVGQQLTVVLLVGFSRTWHRGSSTWVQVSVWRNRRYLRAYYLTRCVSSRWPAIYTDQSAALYPAS